VRTTLITVRLTLRTPGGVTAPENRVTVVKDAASGEQRLRNLLPLRRDPAGSLEIPGTSIAGSLRAHCASYPRLADLFGSEPGDADLVASTIAVLGCVLRVQPEATQRTRTAIDRRRGAPANRTLHAVEQLPAGTEFDVMLRWNNADPAALTDLTEALLAWMPRLGRGSSLGAGRCEVTGLGRAEHDLGTVDGLFEWLAIGGPDGYPTPAPVTTTAAVVAHRVVGLSIVDGLHIGTGEQRLDGEGHHVSTIVRADGRPVVPGSTIKGVLRSRVEYICRACGVHACSGSQPSTCPTDQPCTPCQIFGRAADVNGDGARRGVLAVADALIDGPVVETRRHVALDRFTGGARPELLYTDDVVVAGRFTIILDLLDGPLSTRETALLDAALADLHDGLVGIGARTTAGYGTVRIDDTTWTPPDLGALADLLDTVEVS